MTGRALNLVLLAFLGTLAPAAVAQVGPGADVDVHYVSSEELERGRGWEELE